jgi:hypothetical protein
LDSDPRSVRTLGSKHRVAVARGGIRQSRLPEAMGRLLRVLLGRTLESPGRKRGLLGCPPLM